MIIHSITVNQIVETYFDGVEELDQSAFPILTPARLFIGEYDGLALDLENDFLGWDFDSLDSHRLLWSSEQRLAAFLYIGSWRDTYLFIFADPSSFHAGVEEIKGLYRNHR